MLATLSHEGNITSYYGTNALKAAVAAAVNGDVVTLSSGQFNAVDINKSITVRGAGMAVDSVSGTMPTVLTGDFKVSAPADSTEHNLILEGLYHNHTFRYDSNIKNAQLIKCRFRSMMYSSNNTGNCSFSIIQCRVSERLTLSDNCSATCLNSFIYYPSSRNEKTSNFEMHNCLIYNIGYVESSSFVNCIAIPHTTSGTGLFLSSNMCYNCIAVGNTLNQSLGVFGSIPNTTNKQIAGYGMFQTFDGTFNDNADFVLAEEAAKQYLGTDGTQVGMYGGMMPYETTPNNPQITKFNVASKSTADGKLSVDIEVGVAE